MTTSAMPTATVRVMSPEEIASRGGGETPYFQWPQRGSVFAERSMRLFASEVLPRLQKLDAPLHFEMSGSAPVTTTVDPKEGLQLGL